MQRVYLLPVAGVILTVLVPIAHKAFATSARIPGGSPRSPTASQGSPDGRTRTPRALGRPAARAPIRRPRASRLAPVPPSGGLGSQPAEASPPHRGLRHAAREDVRTRGCPARRSAVVASSPPRRGCRPGQTTRPASWRAASIQPALCRHDAAWPALDEATELARVAHVRART
jgi:hypothetical protein